MEIESDEDVCGVCGDGESIQGNKIVFCDGVGCNIAVHELCYGLMKTGVPEGDWFCKPCSKKLKKRPPCTFCRKDLPLALTTCKQKGKWVHVVCAQFLHSTFHDPEKLEQVSAIKVKPQKLNCCVCGGKQLFKICCESPNCNIHVHPSCARYAKMFLEDISTFEIHSDEDEAKETESDDENIPALRIFLCNQHRASNMKEAKDLYEKWKNEIHKNLEEKLKKQKESRIKTDPSQRRRKTSKFLSSLKENKSESSNFVQPLKLGRITQLKRKAEEVDEASTPAGVKRMRLEKLSSHKSEFYTTDEEDIGEDIVSETEDESSVWFSQEADTSEIDPEPISRQTSSRKKRRFRNATWFTWTQGKCLTSCRPEGWDEMEQANWYNNPHWFPSKSNFRASAWDLESLILASCENFRLKFVNKENASVPPFQAVTRVVKEPKNDLISDSILNTGGSVVSFAWCPVGNIETKCEECVQYLAVSADYQNKYHVVGKPYVEANVIQIWDCGKINAHEEPELALCLLHDFGFCWDMQWVPGAVWNEPDKALNEDQFPRLGLLCCAHSDGKIRIWSIPHPQFLKNEGLEQVVQSRPVFDCGLSDGLLWRLKFNPSPGFPFLLGATTDGRVGVWDFRIDLKEVEEHVLQIPAHRHGTAVRGIDWSPDVPTQFVTCGEDACLRFWDTRDPFCYKLNSCSTRNPLMEVFWLNGIASVLVTSESITVDSNIASHGTRVFSCVQRPTMNLVAETVFPFRDYIPWSVDCSILVDPKTQAVDVDDSNSLRLPIESAFVHVAVGYSNGVTAVYKYQLEDVFGKNDFYKSQIVSVFKQQKNMVHAVDTVEPCDIKKEEDDEKVAEEEVKTSSFIGDYEVCGSDPPIIVRKRLTKDEKLNIASNHLEDKDEMLLQTRLKDDFVSVQRVRLNQSSTQSRIQIASGCIGGLIRIQVLKNEIERVATVRKKA